MAANSQTRGIATLGKRFLSQIRTRTALDPTLRRGVHASIYDKNLDDQDQVNSTLVPDEVTQPQSDKYWAPHPKTGVFSPASEEVVLSGSQVAEGSVLEEKAFFRPLENLDKPLPHP